VLVRVLRSRILTFLLLACFLLAKGSFWIALLPAGTNEKGLPTSHPCACSGAPVCNCGPGGCCDTAEPSKLASLPGLGNLALNKKGANKNSETKSELRTPKVCGHFGLGMGPVGEGAGLVLPTESLILEDLAFVRLELPFVIARLVRLESPDPPPPKA
jgi:hypothetical protein